MVNGSEHAGITTPVLFVHGGKALLTGSSIGKPRLWNSKTGEHYHALYSTGKFTVCSGSYMTDFAKDTQGKPMQAVAVCQFEISKPTD